MLRETRTCKLLSPSKVRVIAGEFTGVYKDPPRMSHPLRAKFLLMSEGANQRINEGTKKRRNMRETQSLRSICITCAPAKRTGKVSRKNFGQRATR